MRCWITPKKTHLVESPDIPRRTGQDPLLPRYGEALLDSANRWLLERELASVASIGRYYNIDANGHVIRGYEEFCFSLEFDLYSYAYSVKDDVLYEWRQCENFHRGTIFDVKAVVEGLKPTTLPNDISIIT